MKICRYNDNRLGIVEKGQVKDVTNVLTLLPALRWPLEHGDHFVRNLPGLLPAIKDLASRADTASLSIADVHLLSPVANPGKIIAAPLNYSLHVAEGSDPAINQGVHMPDFEGFATPIDKFGLFLKSQTGLVGPGDGIELHFPNRRNDHEVELAVVIGKRGKRIARAEALGHVAGYCIGLDMTVRGPEDRSFRKSADSYSVLGPWLVTADEITDPDDLDFHLSVNGLTRQRSNTRELICDVPDLIARASRVYELYPGDVIMTGTPEGVGAVEGGDRVHAWFETIGEMEVLVR